MRFQDEAIRQDILRELNRDGQVFFVHNRVNDIDLLAKKLRELVPEADIRVGHGQMPEDQLEEVMVDFVAGRFDVLLATTMVSAQTVRPVIVRTARQPAAAALQPRAPRETQSLINGIALDRDQTPLPKANVRLRNLEINAVEQIITSNELGRFTFVARPEIPYVVEVADEAGRTIAVGDVIVTKAGEVAGARLVLPTHLPALAGVFNDTASAVTVAAADTGLTGVDPALPKLSPSR